MWSPCWTVACNTPQICIAENSTMHTFLWLQWVIKMKQPGKKLNWAFSGFMRNQGQIIGFKLDWHCQYPIDPVNISFAVLAWLLSISTQLHTHLLKCSILQLNVYCKIVTNLNAVIAGQSNAKLNVKTILCYWLHLQEAVINWTLMPNSYFVLWSYHKEARSVSVQRLTMNPPAALQVDTLL